MVFSYSFLNPFPAKKKSHLKKPGSYFPLGLSWLFTAILLSGCISKTPVTIEPAGRETLPPPIREQKLSRLGYTIQIGAFSHVENALKQVNSLRRHGLEAYFFVFTKGIYKVRFGDFPSEKSAREKAESLKSQGIIEEFYIISPGEFAVSKLPQNGIRYLREELIKTAEKFIGTPYLWGGTSPEEGFDCSGLTMVTYQLNGLNLPRSSRAQFEFGIPVEQEHLSPGDLVFFSIKNPGKVSHVGIYIGEGKFIHSPRWGKKIRVESLSKSYFQKRFAGARTYLDFRL